MSEIGARCRLVMGPLGPLGTERTGDRQQGTGGQGSALGSRNGPRHEARQGGDTRNKKGTDGVIPSSALTQMLQNVTCYTPLQS